MSDKSVFDPEKISIVEHRMVKGQIDAPDSFDPDAVIGHNLNNVFQLAFNTDENLARAELTVEISTKSVENDKTAAFGNYQFVFIYEIENLKQLTSVGEDGSLKIQPILAQSLASITYSTTRGILITRLQGTCLEGFILPVINPNNLI